MERLNRLSAEQEALLPAMRDDWLAHGLSTEPADRAAAERGVALAYEAAGLTPPGIVVWLDSPMAGAIGSWMLRRAQVWAQVGDQVGDQVRDQVWAQVGAQVGDQVRDQVRAQVWDQVWAQVGAQVGDQVRDQVRAQVGDQVWDQVRAQVWAAVYGQHEAGWLSFYDFFGTAAGLTAVAPLAGNMTVARCAGWWWPMRGAVVLTERPTHLSRDQQGRLHDEHGQAITYPDGWGVWCWHGQRVPRWVIEDPTPERIAAEPNIEIRRCAIESYGWDRYVAGWTPVDECDDPGNAPHRLRLYDVPADLWGERVRVLLCVNGTPEPDGTPRRYGLTVPGHFTRAIQAAAASYRVTEAEYATLARRS